MRHIVRHKEVGKRTNIEVAALNTPAIPQSKIEDQLAGLKLEVNGAIKDDLFTVVQVPIFG